MNECVFEGSVNQTLGQNSMVHCGLNQKTGSMANTAKTGKVFPPCICISLTFTALKQHSGLGGFIRPCLAESIAHELEAHSIFNSSFFIYVHLSSVYHHNILKVSILNSVK